MLTICYVTGRKDNQVRWFFDSLHRELHGRYDDVEIIVVDFWAEAQRPGEGWSAAEAKRRREAYPPRCRAPADRLRVVAPAPNVWQGPHRLTRHHYYAKSNALNTAVAHARGSHLLFVDDLSLLSPGYLGPVREAMRFSQRITAFAQDKHDGMVIENGSIVRSRPRPPRPFDHRVRDANGRVIRTCDACSYGCGILVPLEAALAVNGWPEDCDGMRSQDSAFGIVAAAAGFPIYFDPRATLIECGDKHEAASSVVLRGCSNMTRPGDRRTRKQVFLERCRSGPRRFENYYGTRGLRGLREDVRAGRPLPIRREPSLDWFTKTPLTRFEWIDNNELARKMS